MIPSVLTPKSEEITHSEANQTSGNEIISAERGIKLLGVSRGELLEVLEATQIHTYASADIGALLTELANLSRDVETLLGESFCGIITEPSSGEEWNGFDFFTSFAGMMIQVGQQLERCRRQELASKMLALAGQALN
jgi:hypothetical protein